jgi:hypothetical protein
MINIVYPLSKKGDITSGYGWRKHPTKKGKEIHHNGVDIKIPVGTPVIAISDGTVVRADNSDKNGYGNFIIIEHLDDSLFGEDSKFYSAYAHLSKMNVDVGDEVKKGSEIGLSGGKKGAVGAGNSTGPHLHFELRKIKNAKNWQTDWHNPQPRLKIALLIDKTKEDTDPLKDKIENIINDIKNEEGEVDIEKVKEKFKEKLKDLEFREKLAKKLNIDPDELEEKLKDEGYLPTMVAAAKEILGSAAPVIFNIAHKVWNAVDKAWEGIKGSETVDWFKKRFGPDSSVIKRYEASDKRMYEQEEKLKKIIKKIL